ncbi:MAG: EFR1 family ferrodoxin [Coriobacteriia bacterium]|nr:EFR1 family ferrodoxin [Coriobacteriia bacterium]
MSGTLASVEIHYMTGTGNSLRTSAWMQGAAEAAGATATLQAIGADHPTLGDAQMLGVVFPTHGFTAPWGVIKYVARLPRLTGRSAFVMATRAGWGWERLRLPGFEGTGSWLIASMLALKGAQVRGITGVDMPSNWTVLHPGMRPANVSDIISRAHVRVDAFSSAVFGGGRLYRGWISLLFGLLLAPISLGYLLIGRLLLSKLLVADERCTSCGLCAKTCPFDAVRMLGDPPRRPYWTYSCEGCMRCMNVCPEEAVQAWQPGILVLIALATAIGAPVGALVTAAGLAGDSMVGRLAGEAASWAVMLAAWALGYGALWLASRWTPVARLLGRTTFTRLYRRYREPDTDLRRV